MWKEMKNKSLCEFLPHCVTQSVVWSSDDSPSSFSLDPTERSKLLLNYLLPSLPAYSLLALCVCIYVQCCHTECVFKWPCVCVCVCILCPLSTSSGIACSSCFGQERCHPEAQSQCCDRRLVNTDKLNAA